MKALLTLITAVLFCASCSSLTSDHSGQYNLVMKSEVNFTKLNPARGDKSPQAGTLWGDRNGAQATGFLFKPVDGFQSPPHIHNVTYRGVVMSGLVHNDDPKAEKMWMPAGSFWIQPKGEVHITAAQGDDTLAYIEIDKGPYLVKPSDRAFDSGERPLNIDQCNIVWVDDVSGIQKAYLWGAIEPDKPNGTFLKLPLGFKGKVIAHNDLHAVVIKGEAHYLSGDNSQKGLIETGCYFSSKGSSVHHISSQKETVLYIRTAGDYKIIGKD